MELESILSLRILTWGQSVLVCHQGRHSLLLDQVLDVQTGVSLTDGGVVEERVTIQGVDYVNISLSQVAQYQHGVELSIFDSQVQRGLPTFRVLYVDVCLVCYQHLQRVVLPEFGGVVEAAPTIFVPAIEAATSSNKDVDYFQEATVAHPDGKEDRRALILLILCWSVNVILKNKVLLCHRKDVDDVFGVALRRAEVQDIHAILQDPNKLILLPLYIKRLPICCKRVVGTFEHDFN